MSVETLILRMSSDSESSAANSPVPDSGPDSFSFLAEEAYPLVLRSLVDMGLGEQISLSEDNIGEVSRAASRALFTPDSVFSQFLVAPRVECQITVLLWRLRVTSTCADGQSTLDVPSIPVHILASSLSGLLDNTKLYKGTKQHPVPVRRLALDPHRLTPSTTATSPVVQTPMTPPDSVAGDSTPMSGLPTPKRSVKFRPPPIITRTSSGRGPKSAGTGPITLNFAAAALAEYQIEPLEYHPTTDESPADKPPPSPSKLPPPSPSKLPTKIPPVPQTPSRPSSPTKSNRPRSRPPSPNPPRPASPSKRLKKPPPGVKRSKSLTGKSKKSKEKEKEKEQDLEWRNSSMWTPAGVEAHYRNDSSVRTLGLTGRLPLHLAGASENGEVESGSSALGTPVMSALGTSSSTSALGTPTMSAVGLGTPVMSALGSRSGTPSASAMGTPSLGTPMLEGAIITPFNPPVQPDDPEIEEGTEEGPLAHIEVEAPTPCASPKPSVRISTRSTESSAFFESVDQKSVSTENMGRSPVEENGLRSSKENLAPSGSRENLAPSGSRENLVPSGSRDNLAPSRSRDNLVPSGSRDTSPHRSRDELVPPRTPTRDRPTSLTSDPRTPSPTRSVFPGSSLHVLHSPDTVRSVYSPDPMRFGHSPDLLRSSDLLRSPASSMYRLSMASPSPRRDGSPVPRSILRNSFNGSPARNASPSGHARFPSTMDQLVPERGASPALNGATSPALNGTTSAPDRATSPALSRSASTRSRTISISGASLIRSRTVSGTSLVRNRTVSSSESIRRPSEIDILSRMRTISDLGRTSEENSIRASLDSGRRASIESARRASIESAQRAKVSSPQRTSLESARKRKSSIEKHRMSVDVDGITIMAVSIADATPVTPTPKRTGFNLDVERSPSARYASPGALSLGTGTPNASLGISPGPLSHLSPGAMSLSTVPSLSPFPESDDGDFGFRDGEEEVTVTARGAFGSPVRRGSKRSSRRESPTRRANQSPSPTRRANQSPTRADLATSPPKPTRRPLPPPPQGSPSRASRTFSPPPLSSRTMSPINGRGTPTKQHPGIPPRSWTDSPSRASTSTHQTIGVPMTQVSSRPRTISTQARQPAESGVSESEAESLPFPGSTSTLSLPGDVSLSDVSPFIAPKELSSSSESERPSPWIGPGVTSSPWDPRASSSSSGSPWLGTNSELLGGSGLLINSSLPKLVESPSPRTSVETSRPKSKHSRSGSALGSTSGSGSTAGHERAGSINGSNSRPGSSVGHSRPGSTSGHGRSSSGTHPGLGLRTGQDILVPMISSKAFSRSDVVKLVSRGDSFDSSRDGATSPMRSSALGTVAEYNQPMPVFMVPGADPAKVSGVSRPKSMALVEESHTKVGSEDSDVSEVLNQDGQTMVRTTEVGVGAGRARVQTGVGVGVNRARGGGGVKSKVDSGLRKRVDSGKSEPRARVDSTKSNEPRPRVNSATRPKIDSNLRGRVDSVRRKPVGSSPIVDSPASPTSTTTTTARRVIRKPSSETASRTRKSSNASMRKSSTSSLRSTPPTTVSSPSARKSTRTTSFSSGASTPRSSTPRSSGAFSPRSKTASNSGNATPKAGTPRTSISSGRSSITSPKSNLSKSTTPPKPNSGTTTPKAAPRPLPPRPGPAPPVRPQRSALRPGLRTSVTVPPVPAQPSPVTTATPTSPTRTRAVTMEVKSTSPTSTDPRPRRNTSISSKVPLVSRSTGSNIPTTPVAKSRSSNDVPFPSPESKDSLQVPEASRSLKRSLSVSSAARKLVGRTRAVSPVPPNPPVDTNSLAQSTDASSVERSPQKAPRSLSRLAFSALLPKRGNNAAAEAKAALAQAKAREVAEAKARAKAAAEEAKARAKAEAEEAKAARAAKAKEEKEAKKNSKRFGSLSKRGGQS